MPLIPLSFLMYQPLGQAGTDQLCPLHGWAVRGLGGTGTLCLLCYSAEFYNGLFSTTAKPCEVAQQVTIQWWWQELEAGLGWGMRPAARVRRSVSGMVGSANSGI